MKEALVLLPTRRDRKAFAYLSPRCHFHWPDDDGSPERRPGQNFNLVRYGEHTPDLFRQRKSDAVIYTHDLTNLVAGMLYDDRGLEICDSG